MRVLFILVLFFTCSSRLNAQDRLIELKVGAVVTSTVRNGAEFYYGFGYDLQAHYFIRPKIAIGAFYTRSFNFLEGKEGLGAVRLENAQFQELYGSTSILQYGISCKYSSAREKRLNVYALVNLYRLQSLYDFQDDVGFKIGDEGFAAGIGGGLGLKISRTIGWHLIEVTYNHYISGMNFTKENFGLGEVHIKSGFVFNFMERK